jgi:hypothetical protein
MDLKWGDRAAPFRIAASSSVPMSSPPYLLSLSFPSLPPSLRRSARLCLPPLSLLCRHASLQCRGRTPRRARGKPRFGGGGLPAATLEGGFNSPRQRPPRGGGAPAPSGTGCRQSSNELRESPMTDEVGPWRFSGGGSSTVPWRRSSAPQQSAARLPRLLGSNPMYSMGPRLAPRATSSDGCATQGARTWRCGTRAPSPPRILLQWV